jgi:hypothetical protein
LLIEQEWSKRWVVSWVIAKLFVEWYGYMWVVYLLKVDWSSIQYGWLKFWVVQFVLKYLDSGSLFCVSVWHSYCHSIIFCLNDSCFFMLICSHGTNCSHWNIRWQKVGNPDPLMGVVCCWVGWWFGVCWIHCGDSPAQLGSTVIIHCDDAISHLKTDLCGLLILWPSTCLCFVSVQNWGNWEKYDAENKSHEREGRKTWNA